MGCRAAPWGFVIFAALSAGLFGCVVGRDAAGPDPGRQRVIVEPHTGMTLVRVAGGRLEGGPVFDAGQGKAVTLPATEIEDVYLGMFEVTQAQWRAVMGTNPSRVRGDRRPVEQVSWDDAGEFARRLSVLTGRPFRLPSEAEWEWAFRRGHESLGADHERQTRDSDPSAYAGNQERPVREVGTHAPDALGLFDLGGNLSEWCADRYSSRPADEGCRKDSDDGYRVLRGAETDAAEDRLGRTYRLGFDRSWVGRTIGFRVALSARR